MLLPCNFFQSLFSSCFNLNNFYCCLRFTGLLCNAQSSDFFFFVTKIPYFSSCENSLWSFIFTDFISFFIMFTFFFESLSTFKRVLKSSLSANPHLLFQCLFLYNCFSPSYWTYFLLCKFSNFYGGHCNITFLNAWLLLSFFREYWIYFWLAVRILVNQIHSF